MGIYKFYSEYIGKRGVLPGWVAPRRVAGLQGKKFDALLIDANGILHPIAQKVFQYADYKDLPPKKLKYSEYLDEYKTELFDFLFKLLERTGSPKLVIIAVDGVAPAAKITQQRSRRYSAEEAGEIAGGLFDSAMITPGTDFMKSVDLMLEDFVDQLKDLQHQVVYSGHMSPGEGEHKMFWIAKDLLDRSKSVIVDGLDADLFMISLTAEFSVTLLRGDHFFEIDNFKKYLQISLQAGKRRIKYERIYDDFIIMLYLVGNDFLPKLEMISDVSEMVALLTEIHLDLPRSLSKGNGKIDFAMLKLFFQKLASREEFFLKRKTSEAISYFYPHKVLHSQEVVDVVNSESYMRLVASRIYKDLNAVDIANDYIDGIFWVFNYYTQRSTWSKRWIYPHDLPPLARYLSMAMERYSLPREIFEQNMFFTPSQQLVSVIPPSIAEKILPRKLSKFILQGGDLEDLAPVKTELVLSGIKKEKDTFMGKRLLPKLDVQRVLDTVKF